MDLSDGLIVQVRLKIIDLNRLIKMLKSFLRRPLYNFASDLQNAFSLKFKVKDVTKIRGLDSGNAYIMIEGEKINIPQTNIIASVVAESPFFRPNEPIKLHFLDIHQNLFLPTSPALSLLQNSFYVKLNNQLYYVANQEPFIKTSMNAEYIATDAPPCLEEILEDSIKTVNEVPDNITPSNLNTVIIKEVMEHAAVYKLEKVRMKELLKITEDRIKQFDRQIEAINEIVSKKAANRTRLFSTFMIAQYATIHYLIYFHLSWDIMEPITVILTNLDILIGYYFFVFKGREYSLEELQKSMEEKHKFKYLKKHKFNLEKYEELLELRNHFQMRLDLLSKSPFVIMDRLQKPLKLLDTR